MEIKLFAIFVRYLVGGSTNEPWARTRGLCLLAWKPLADTSERNRVNMDDPCWHTIVFFFFFFCHRLYYSSLFFRKIVTTKKLTTTIKRAAILVLNAKRSAGLSKAILWYVNVHLYVLNQIFLNVYIFFLSFFLSVFNLLIVLHF